MFTSSSNSVSSSGSDSNSDIAKVLLRVHELRRQYIICKRNADMEDSTQLAAQLPLLLEILLNGQKVLVQQSQSHDQDSDRTANTVTYAANSKNVKCDTSRSRDKGKSKTKEDNKTNSGGDIQMAEEAVEMVLELLFTLSHVLLIKRLEVLQRTVRETDGVNKVLSVFLAAPPAAAEIKKRAAIVLGFFINNAIMPPACRAIVPVLVDTCAAASRQLSTAHILRPHSHILTESLVSLCMSSTDSMRRLVDGGVLAPLLCLLSCPGSPVSPSVSMCLELICKHSYNSPEYMQKLIAGGLFPVVVKADRKSVV